MYVTFTVTQKGLLLFVMYYYNQFLHDSISIVIVKNAKVHRKNVKFKEKLRRKNVKAHVKLP